MKRVLMFVLRMSVRLFFLAAIVGAFYNVPYCWLAMKTQGLVWGLVVTLLLGRFFCRSMCPLGMLQSLVNVVFHPKSHVRRVCTRLPETKTQRIVRWSVFAVCVALGVAGCMGAVTMVLPISIFGKALTLWTPGVVVASLVLALAIFGQGRIWCNWVCPYGTLFGLVARITLRKDKVETRCRHCRKCFRNGEAESSPLQGNGRASSDSSGEDTASPLAATRRETLKGVAVLAVADKLTDGGLAEVSLPGVPERGLDVLPPGAVDRRKFSLKCVGCQLCIANCPGHCLQPSVKFATFGQPVLDFRQGYCLTSCVKCSEVCPERALEFLQREQRPFVHVGGAVWEKARCVRTTNGDACTACVRKCPVQAIHLVKGFPVVDRDRCVGCGACEHVCPARPLPAIYVKGYEMQRIVTPISEADLLKEMRARLDAGAAVVVARDGVIVAVEEGRGIGPLLKLLDGMKLQGALVVDRVIGRAAAAICAKGGVRKVCTPLAGKGAAELLEKRGIVLEAEQTVERILNRDKTDSCPMEKAVADMDDPAKMVETLRKKVAELRKAKAK